MRVADDSDDAVHGIGRHRVLDACFEFARRPGNHRSLRDGRAERLGGGVGRCNGSDLGEG